ncbi:MAG: transglycosylase SLT domain-containing protein, partial [Sphingomicrobium sp.]
PALAQGGDPLAPLPTGPVPTTPVPATPVPTTSVPSTPAPAVQFAIPVPPPVLVVPRDWRGVFSAIRAGDWRAAEAGIATLPATILTPAARAELYTARGSPAVDLPRLLALLAEAPELPQAEQIARLAIARGATVLPPIYPRYPVVGLGAAPSRTRARAVQGEPLADQLRSQIDPLLEADDAPGAETLLIPYAPSLSSAARAEASQRIAWTYYRLGRDLDARRLADAGRLGAAGEWAAHSAWVSGLASWRLGDCEAASRSFREVVANSRERELVAGAYYWTARAEQMCRRPRSVAPLLKAAARSPESFYGLIARATLGMDTHLPPDPHNYAARVEGLPNVRRSVELVRIGERWLGEEMLRHQARIGRADEHHGLIEFAKRLDLAGAQFWLAHNGQRGAVADVADRYPAPRWTPLTGWRVDPALAFGHIIQESTFRADAVSPIGAVGLMQVRPGTAQDMARQRGLNYSRGTLTDPATNLESGQSFIELIRRSAYTGGQLPKVIAAYNAGPLPVGRWAAIYDKGDPLLWIESIPYWETRYYVPAVLRNMWVYQGLSRTATPSLSALSQHRWPAFPTGMTRLAEQ